MTHPTTEIKETAASEAPMDLLLQADPSIKKVEDYLRESKCFIATLKGQVVGACVVKPVTEETHELMNISVAPEYQKTGIGRKLLQHVITSSRKDGVKRLEVGTGTFGYQLAFYQREGFRVDSIEKDFFLINYEEPIHENGIQLQDMLRLVLRFEKN